MGFLGPEKSRQDLKDSLGQRRLNPGMDTRGWFFQVRNQKEHQKMVLIPFINLEKINIFGSMHKGVAQKLSLPCPLENQTFKRAINESFLKPETSPSGFK